MARLLRRVQVAGIVSTVIPGMVAAGGRRTK
jgi:hypothetical protein